MNIGMLTLTLRLPGCHSLKQKRQRLGGLKDRFGKLSNLAVSESDFHDQHQQAQWCFVSLCQDQASSNQLLDNIEQQIATKTDAVIIERNRQWL
jgi:uncharacterized protein